MNKRLEVHDKMKREFINISTHEMRTQIQPVLGLLGLVQVLTHTARETNQEELYHNYKCKKTFQILRMIF